MSEILFYAGISIAVLGIIFSLLCSIYYKGTSYMEHRVKRHFNIKKQVKADKTTALSEYQADSGGV